MRSALILAFLLLSSCAVYAAVPACVDDERSNKAIEAAIQHGNDSGSDVAVSVDKICGDYAKASVTVLEDSEMETAYLKKDDNEWVILNIGDVDPETLHIPKEVW
jgi:hypothetical protein